MKAVLLSLLVVAAGCGSGTVLVRGVRPLNLNDAGESTPVDVRVYQLKDDKRFLESEFEDLWMKDQEILEDAWVAKPAVATVLPGEEDDAPVEVDMGKIDGDTKYVGVMALFHRSWKGQRRRRAVPLQDADDCVFELRGYGLVLDVERDIQTLDLTTPVEIRVFQLDNVTRFSRVEFDDLWFKARQTLEEDLLEPPLTTKVFAVDERGTPASVDVGELKVAARNLGVLAVYSRMGRQEKHREVIALSEKSEYVFNVGGYGITLKVIRK